MPLPSDSPALPAAAVKKGEVPNSPAKPRRPARRRASDAAIMNIPWPEYLRVVQAVAALTITDPPDSTAASVAGEQLEEVLNRWGVNPRAWLVQLAKLERRSTRALGTPQRMVRARRTWPTLASGSQLLPRISSPNRVHPPARLDEFTPLPRRAPALNDALRLPRRIGGRLACLLGTPSRVRDHRLRRTPTHTASATPFHRQRRLAVPFCAARSPARGPLFDPSNSVCLRFLVWLSNSVCLASCSTHQILCVLLPLLLRHHDSHVRVHRRPPHTGCALVGEKWGMAHIARQVANWVRTWTIEVA